MSLTTRAGLVGLALAVCGDAGSAFAEPDLPPVIGATEVFAAEPFSGLALRGFDPVAYFARGAPAPGRADLDAVWGGVAWRFASEANRAAFRRDPAAFAPRLGGYDPLSLAEGRVVAADPAFFAVEGERLYLFRNRESRRRALGDRTLLDAAEARWPDLRDDLVQP